MSHSQCSLFSRPRPSLPRPSQSAPPGVSPGLPSPTAAATCRNHNASTSLRSRPPSTRATMDLATLRADIKTWERDFKAHHGRQPTIEEIKQLPAMGTYRISSFTDLLSYPITSRKVQALQETLQVRLLCSNCFIFQTPSVHPSQVSVTTKCFIHPSQIPCSQDRGHGYHL